MVMPSTDTLGPHDGTSSSTRRPRVDIIVPVLNEAPTVVRQLAQLQQQDGVGTVIVVDGGSSDGTTDIVHALASESDRPRATVVRLIDAPRGRALQMNAGAAEACADVLLFLHSDTRLPADAVKCICDAVVEGSTWGHFDVRLDGAHVLFRIIERLMNLRAALTGIATGDQAIFVRGDVFRMLGGYAPIALMEDVELCTRLKWLGRPARLRLPVCASVRRWRAQGIVRTVVLMWTLRLLYWFGMSPSKLVRAYVTVL